MNKCAPILLVEDNMDDSVLLTRALQNARIQNPICVVTSIKESIDFLEKNRKNVPVFVIISLDMFLSGGQAVISWMKQQDFLQQVPVIAIGSSDRQQDIQKAYDLGVNAYFAKQFDTNDLAKMIRELQFLEEILPNNKQTN